MRTVVFFLGLSCCWCLTFADVIECDNGDRYNGKLLSIDETKVKLQNEIPSTITITRKRIVSISFRPAQASVPKARNATNAPALSPRSGVELDSAAVERV